MAERNSLSAGTARAASTLSTYPVTITIDFSSTYKESLPKLSPKGITICPNKNTVGRQRKTLT
jgi:hypothetical protein